MSSLPERGFRPPRPSHARAGTLDGAANGSLPVVLRGADAGAPPAPRAPREGAVLRGGAASSARPYRQLADASLPAPRPEPSPIERRTTVRRAEDQPVAGGRPTFRLGEVYAEELSRLRAQAHAEGFAAGHAEGMAVAADVVAQAERAAAERMAEEIGRAHV